MINDKYFKQVMSIGLLPIIGFLTLSLFISETISLYIFTIISLIYYIYESKKNTLFTPSIILFNSLISLTICSILSLLPNKYFLPIQSLSLILITIIFCLSFIYTMFPEAYNKIDRFYYYKYEILNHWSCQIILLGSLIFIAIASICTLLLKNISPLYFYSIFYILPIIIFSLCIAFNWIFIKKAQIPLSKIPLIRVLILCNGKLLVTKKKKHSFYPNKFDTPVEDYVDRFEDNHDELVKDMIISSKIVNIKKDKLDPRFNLKYIFKDTKGEQLVLLYVLPINDEKCMTSKKGHFVDPQSISKEIDEYTPYINNELPHITMAASLWNDFK